MNGNGKTSQGLRILLVEDEPDTAESLAILLRLYGHEVDLASDGLTALRIAEERPPDVALLDHGLPGKMDGCEIARRLREQAKGRMPLLVALTGYGREQDRIRSAEAGMLLHLVKPADPATLNELLERFRAVSKAGTV